MKKIREIRLWQNDELCMIIIVEKIEKPEQECIENWIKEMPKRRVTIKYCEI